jgi:hypothetical protein
MFYKSYNPKHRVTIFRAANGYLKEDISDDIIKIDTSKTYGRCFGGFTIQTTFIKRIDDKRYDDLLMPNDIILIELSKRGIDGLVPDMLGLVSRCARVIKVDDKGRPEQRISIQGQDFGKLLNNNNCGFDVAKVDKFLGDSTTYYQKLNGYLLAGTPNTLVQSAYDLFFTKQLGDWVDGWILPDAISSPDDWQKENMVVTGDTGSVWAAMKLAENAPYNTLYTYTGTDGKFHVGLEKTPFNDETGKLSRNTFHEFDAVDIVDENVGRSDSELINYIYFKTTLGMQLGENNENALVLKGDGVKYDEESVRLHGYRPYKPSSVFSPFFSEGGAKNRAASNEGSSTDARAAVKTRTEAFWNWMHLNHEYESGDFVIHGSPEIRAGDGVLHVGINKEYFVEQVANSYSIEGPEFTTKLGVTRGQDHGR